MKLEVYCPYLRGWKPLGRSRKKCPHCGAMMGLPDGPAADVDFDDPLIDLTTEAVPS